MPRKLKTYITNLGFFELAIAAPSMKAALEAWGLEHNAFKHGFAKQTDDPRIVAAAEAAPGTVLRRPIGSKGAFKEQADLPNVTAFKSAAKISTKPVGREAERRPNAKRPAEPQPKSKLSVTKLEAARRASEKRKKLEAKARERAEAEAARGAARKEQAMKQAMASLSAARTRHEKVVADIEHKRASLDAEFERENERWEKERHRLEAALFRRKR